MGPFLRVRRSEIPTSIQAIVTITTHQCVWASSFSFTQYCRFKEKKMHGSQNYTRLSYVWIPVCLCLCVFELKIKEGCVQVGMYCGRECFNLLQQFSRSSTDG